MTCGPALHAPLPLHPDLAGQLIRIHIPALRERPEDIRAIADAFLRNASPFERFRCSRRSSTASAPMTGRAMSPNCVPRCGVFCWKPHDGLLDVRNLANLMCRDESRFAMLQGAFRPVRRKSKPASSLSTCRRGGSAQ